MKVSELKSMIRESVRKSLAKNQPALQENLSEYSNDALTDMIINLSRFEDTKDLIDNIKQELAKRKQLKNTKVNELKLFIKETIKKSLAENQPAPAPAKPERGTEVHPGKPGEKQKPRRTFEPKPGAEPRPKALSETEKQIVDKIVQRMKDKK